jgi:transcription antitermination factor NusG
VVDVVFATERPVTVSVTVDTKVNLVKEALAQMTAPVTEAVLEKEKDTVNVTTLMLELTVHPASVQEEMIL